MTDQNARDPLVVLTFRHRQSIKAMLGAIGESEGHPELSTTLREAVDQYVASFLARKSGKARMPVEADRLAA